MNETDLQKVEEGFAQTIDSYSSIGLTEPDKAKYLGIMQKESSIILNEEKRKEDLAFQKDRFELEKDHKYFEENLAKEKLKQESKWHDEENASKKELFEYQKTKDANDFSIQKLRFDLDKQRLDFEQKDLEFKRDQAKTESKYRWITFGITTALGFAQFAMSLHAYKKLAYTNLKLIYCDEGRPTTDYKDAIRNVQNMIKK